MKAGDPAATAAGSRPRPEPARRGWRNGRAAGALLVAGLALAYFTTFVDYGFHLGEDGDVVYLIYRTADGQRPYVDFASGYTPGFFYANGALLRLLGVDLQVLRWSMVVVNSLAALCLYELAARVVPPALAVVAALGYLALLPVYGGEFATFNIPYPAWHVVVFWVLSLLAFLRGRAGGRRRWIFIAGLLAGIGCTFKPNTGAFNFAALAFLLLASCPPERSLPSRAAWLALLLGVLVALCGTFGFRLYNHDARLLLWPVFALAAAIVARTWRLPPGGGFTARALLLIVGFAAVMAPWMLYYLAVLGGSRFLYDVLYIGTSHELFFYLPIRALGLWDVLLALAALAFFATRWIPTRWLRPRLLLPLGAAAASVAAAGLWSAPMPEGFQRAAMQRLEHLAYGAAVIVHCAGVLLVARRLRRQPAAAADDGRWCAELAVAVSAPLFFLSTYPRGDFFHWVLSTPMTLVLAVLLYWRVAARWPSGRQRLAWAAAPLYALVLLVWFPGLSLAAHLLTTPADGFAPLGVERGTVELEVGRAARLRSLREVVAYIQRHSAPGDTLLGFPNLHLLNFLTGRHVPGRHGSFHPGWPDHMTEAEIVESLHQRRTPLVVLNLSPQLYSGNAPVYYFLLRDYLQRNFRLAASMGDYRILERKAGGGEAASPSPEQAATEVAMEPGQGMLDCRDAVRFVERTRSESARPLRSCWDGATPQLQEEAVEQARSARDAEGAATLAAALRDGLLAPRAALLAVRAIGESGDARSVPVAADALQRVDGRVRDELATALFNIALRAFSDGHHLYWRPPGLDQVRDDEDLGRTARQWLAGDDPRLQYAGAWIASVRRDGDAASDLRRMLGHPAVEFRALAAEALIQMGQTDGIGERLLAGMAQDEMYLPTALVQWSRAEPAEARALLADSFRRGNPLQRESIAFVAGALGDPALAEVIRAGLSDPVPRVRMASLWAAAALDDQPARPLMEQAARDPVERVRRFARLALERLDEGKSSREGAKPPGQLAGSPSRPCVPA